MPNNFNQIIDDNEFLYRGIIEHNWDYENNRPSSATYKDSKGVSVDRDGQRGEKECVDYLNGKKNFFAVCKVKAQTVRELNAITKYLPIENINPFHSEIHDSETRIQMRGSKPKKIRDASEVVFKK